MNTDGMSTGQIVEAYYKKWLNREPKEAGKSHYIWEIDQEGLSLDAFEDILKNSPEFQKTAGKQVDTWYQEILGREAEESGRNHYINKIKEQGFDDLSDIEDIFYNSQEYQKKKEEKEQEAADDNKIIIHGKEYKLPVHGQGGTDFGGADYYYLLAKAGKGPDGKDGNFKDIDALQDARESILYWLQKGKGKEFLHDSNKPGAPNKAGPDGLGLYDMIVQSGVEHSSGGKQFSSFGDHSKLDDPHAYGLADVLAARAGGHTEFEIYSHMRNNKHLWDKAGDTYDSHRDLYNNIRGDLIKIGNAKGNLQGKDVTSGGVDYSWRNTLQNPLWQELGVYMKKHNQKGFGDKSLDWIATNKDAYKKIIEWQEERANAFDFISKNDSGDLVTTFTTDKQLQQLIGVQGGDGEVTPPGTTKPGEYWSSWGELGPGALNKPMLMAAGPGLGWEFEDEDKIDSALDKLEERFLSEMYKGVPENVTDKHGKKTVLGDPLFKKAKDSWGLDIVRKNMRPEDFDEDWFDDKTGVMNKTKFQDLAYGDLESIDWAFYAENKLYQQAREDLGMDAAIDEVKEIRQANVWVQAKLATGVDSDLVEDHVKYKPVFDSKKATPYKPQDLKIEGYTPESLKTTKKPADPPDAPTINIVPPDIERPDNLPNDLKIVETV